MSYDGEICMDCGFPIVHYVGSFWSAAHDLWADVVGGHEGILCPPCFTRRCADLGIHVSWHPTVWSRDASSSSAKRPTVRDLWPALGVNKSDLAEHNQESKP